jgi:hypothetical protein
MQLKSKVAAKAYKSLYNSIASLMPYIRRLNS